MIRFDFHGRHLFVNGGTGGIGRAIVTAFARAGAIVSFVYAGGENASAEATEIQRDVEKFGTAAWAKEVDSSDWKSIHAAIGECLAEHGGVDVLINVAGITRDGMLWKLGEQEWDSVMRVNAGSYFNCIHALAPQFRERKSGRIINITSINGMRGKAGQANYTASKAAVIGLTKTAAKELGSSNVTVNAIAPGFIETAMTNSLLDDVKQRAIAETVFNRAGSTDDVANAALFLASDEARHITGVVLKVDGGQYI